MAARRPRIKDEDLLTNDDLLLGGVEHEWVRCAAYKEGHRVSRDGRTAICGRPLLVSEPLWEGFRSAYESCFGKELPEWYIALDRRKGSKCSGCKKEDRFPLEDPMAEDPQPTDAPLPYAPHVTTPDRLQDMRTRTKVAMVKRELAATEITEA